jgi:hypothetical protein
MAEPLGFAREFRDLLQAARIPFALTSGMACVYYGIQQTTKDTDWIVAPGHLDTLRTLLAEQERRLPPWLVGYRSICGAPLDPRWLANGWTSHLVIQDSALEAEHHLDFFGRPPRAPVWAASPEGIACRATVAAMKRTDRDRDWAFVDGLGWQLSEADGDLEEALVNVQDEARLRHLWNRAPAACRESALRRRPLLQMVQATTDPVVVEAHIRLERLFWQCVNRERHGRYQAAWKTFFRSWRQEPDWSWPRAESFALQHEHLLAAALHHGLPTDPLTDLAPSRLRELAIQRAAALSLVAPERIASIAPPTTEPLT